MYKWLFILTLVGVIGCKNTTNDFDNTPKNLLTSGVVVLGIAQDAGFPQADCRKDCCKDAWSHPELRRHATCLALFDSLENKYWLFEATPDIKFQMNHFQKITIEQSVNWLSLKISLCKISPQIVRFT